MTVLDGKWYLVSSEKFEEYLVAIGVNDENRQKALGIMNKTGQEGYVEEIMSCPEGLCRQIYIAGKPMGAKSPCVPLDKEISGDALDGRPIKLIVSVEGNKVIRKETGPNYNSTLENVVNGSDRTMTLTCGSVISVRKFKKL